MLKLLNASNSKLALDNSRTLLTNSRVEFFRQYRRRVKQPWQYEKDDYRQKVHEYRLKNIKEFWDRQTLFENEYIGKINTPIGLTPFLQRITSNSRKKNTTMIN